GADRAAGDHPGALRGRLEEDLARRVVLVDLVRDRRADGGHADEMLLRVLDTLADGLGDLRGLAEAHTDGPAAVADDADRAEAEAAAALDDFGHAVDLDDALLERELVRIDLCQRSLLELETRFARGIGEGPDAAVVPEPGAVEDDRADAGLLCPLGDEP